MIEGQHHLWWCGGLSQTYTVRSTLGGVTGTSSLGISTAGGLGRAAHGGRGKGDGGEDGDESGGELHVCGGGLE